MTRRSCAAGLAAALLFPALAASQPPTAAPAFTAPTALVVAGAQVGDALRGDAVATYVVAHAADGYRAVFALAELDNAFVPSDVIVADTVDGKPLFSYQGPWRLVAPKDLRGARSVRLIQRLDLVRLPR